MDLAPSWALAGVAAVAVAAVCQPALWWESTKQTAALPPPDAIGAALAVLATLPLVLLPRRPVVALAGCALPLLCYDALGYPASPVALAVLIALGWVAASSGPTVAYLSIAALAGAVALAASIGPQPHVLGGLVADVVMVLAAGVIGLMVRTHRLHTQLAGQERSAREARLRLEAQQAAVTERLRIARALHDAVGHGITLLTLGAEAAARLVETEPGQSRELLVQAATSGRETLAELRALLGILREAGAEAQAVWRCDLAGVVQRFSGLGLQVDLALSGQRRALTGELESAAAAIVAEGLANVAQHAHAGRSTVRLCFEDKELVVEVADDGPGSPGGIVFGLGLRGARERAEAAGGTVVFGAGPGGGLLRAVLPYANGART